MPHKIHCLSNYDWAVKNQGLIHDETNEIKRKQHNFAILTWNIIMPELKSLIAMALQICN